MRVGVEREPEMTDVLGRVLGVREAPEHLHRDRRAVRPVLHVLEKFRELPRFDVLGVRHLEPQRDKVLAKLVEALGIRPRVHAVETRDPVPPQELRSLHVGGDHALLDEPVSVIALDGPDLVDLAVRIQFEADLRQVELDRAPPAARLREGLVQVVQPPDGLVNVSRHGSHIADQEVVDLAVGQPCTRAHDAFFEGRAGDLALGTDPHVANHAQPVDLRIQRTQAVRQHFGQHRHDAVREVHGGPARDRLAVERRVDLDVVCDVGDRDHEPPAAPRLLAINRVVEIARVGTVDRDERHVPEIDAPLLGRRRHRFAELADFVAHGAWPFRGDAVRLDRDIGRDALLVGRTDDIDDLARGLLDVARVVENARHDDLARLGARGVAFADQDPVRNLRVVRHDDADAAFADKLPRHLVRAALEHLDELALRLATTVRADDLDRNAVTVERRPHLACGQVDVVAAVVGDHEAEAVAMAAHLAGNQLYLAGQAELVAAVLDDLAGPDHGLQPVGQL